MTDSRTDNARWTSADEAQLLRIGACAAGWELAMITQGQEPSLSLLRVPGGDGDVPPAMQAPPPRRPRNNCYASATARALAACSLVRKWCPPRDRGWTCARRAGGHSCAMCDLGDLATSSQDGTTVIWRAHTGGLYLRGQPRIAHRLRFGQEEMADAVAFWDSWAASLVAHGHVGAALGPLLRGNVVGARDAPRLGTFHFVRPSVELAPDGTVGVDDLFTAWCLEEGGSQFVDVPSLLPVTVGHGGHAGGSAGLRLQQTVALPQATLAGTAGVELVLRSVVVFDDKHYTAFVRRDVG